MGQSKALSSKAQEVIHKYFNLPFTDVPGVRCPYFNNARKRKRGELRVLVGKGSPSEIVEEAKIISLQYHAGIFDHLGNCCLSCSTHNHGEKENEETVQQCIRKFLIDNDLGIECSGFVTQVLRAHYLQTRGVDIVKKIQTVSARNFFRFLIAKLRPLENISVKVLADKCNSVALSDWKSAQAGDLIVVLEIKAAKPYNHILLVTENDGEKIKYVHARAWSSEGKYGHGVAEGVIKITSPEKGLLEQVWEELGKIGVENETWKDAKSAQKVEVRRLMV